MAKRVPYCTECEYAKEIYSNYKEYYCKHSKGDNMRLGVDSPPQRSPKWCPKRDEPDPTPKSKCREFSMEEKKFLLDKFNINL